MEDRILANIIYKELFSYGAVFLPQVGYISFVENPAVLSPDGSTLTPPYRTLAAFMPAEPIAPFVNAVDAISQAMSVDRQTATGVYDRYIRRNTNDTNILTVPYVLRVDLNDMTILNLDERIDSALREQQMEPVVLRESRQYTPAPQRVATDRKIPYRQSPPPATWQLVFSIAAVSLALLYLVYRFLPAGLI